LNTNTSKPGTMERGGITLKSKSTGLMTLREPSSSSLARIALEGLRKRSKKEVSLGEAAYLLGCNNDQVVDTLSDLVRDMPDFWDWNITHGEDYVTVEHRFTRREAANIKNLIKRPEFQQVCQLPLRSPFNANEAARILKLPRKKTTVLLARCVGMGYLNHSILVPKRGPKTPVWQRKF